MGQSDLKKAAAAWDVGAETLEQVNLRIHDKVADEDELQLRADSYISQAFSNFDYVELNGGEALEIGSGTGYIMEAADRYLKPKFPQHSVTGLDISTSMIEKAKERLADRSAYKNGTLTFAHYDGVTMPFSDNKFDFIYSVASLQHVPKPYVYNLFFEIKRILKPDGYAIIHMAPFVALKARPEIVKWRSEVLQQIGAIPAGHWHYYYTAEEMYHVLAFGTGFAHVHSMHSGGWTCCSKTPFRLPKDFNPQRFLELNPDIKAQGLDAAEYYAKRGHRERRPWR